MFSGHRICEQSRDRNKVAHQCFDRFLPADSFGAGRLDRASPSGAGDTDQYVGVDHFSMHGQHVCASGGHHERLRPIESAGELRLGFAVRHA